MSINSWGYETPVSTYNHSDMERSKRIQQYARADRLVRKALQQGPPPFTPEENKHFQESLAACELDIAFDLLCWSLAKRDIRFPKTFMTCLPKLDR